MWSGWVQCWETGRHAFTVAVGLWEIKTGLKRQWDGLDVSIFVSVEAGINSSGLYVIYM